MENGQHIIISTTDSIVEGVIAAYNARTGQVTVVDEIGSLTANVYMFTVSREADTWILEA